VIPHLRQCSGTDSPLKLHLPKSLLSAYLVVCHTIRDTDSIFATILAYHSLCKEQIMLVLCFYMDGTMFVSMHSCGSVHSFQLQSSGLLYGAISEDASILDWR